MSTNESLDYREIAIGLGLKPTDLIQVCSNCKRASCWAGIFLCSECNRAGTAEMTVDDLCKYQLEHPSYWLDNKVEERNE